MINNAIQLKAKVKNVSNGDDRIAKAYIRIFFMERFVERVSLSKYRDNFIVKGGMLVSSLLGVNVRSTMDIDTTVKALPLTESAIKDIIGEIININVDDGVSFEITDSETIMDEFDYPGVRVHFVALMDRLKQPLKIDVSTDDVITPGAIEYDYKLMFEERTIQLNTYNIETTLAEKAQTILYRGLANTRMRDFYDVYELVRNTTFSWETAREAFAATCKRRESQFSKSRAEEIMNNISDSKELEETWNTFAKKNHFVGEISFADVIPKVRESIIKMVDTGETDKFEANASLFSELHKGETL